jgi:hypothetical protein
MGGEPKRNELYAPAGAAVRFAPASLKAPMTTSVDFGNASADCAESTAPRRQSIHGETFGLRPRPFPHLNPSKTKAPATPGQKS